MSVLKRRGASRTPGDTVWRKMRSFFLQNRGALFSPPFSRPNAEERRRAMRRRSGRSSSLQTEWACKAIAPCYEKWTRRGNTEPARADRGKDANIFTLSRVVGAQHWWKDKASQTTPPSPHPLTRHVVKGFCVNIKAGRETTRRLQPSGGSCPMRRSARKQNVQNRRMTLLKKKNK